MLDRVNVVVVSDHGMAETSRERVLVLEDLLSRDEGEAVDVNPTLNVWPAPGSDETLFTRLASASPHLNVYRRGHTPPEWHYVGHPRIAPIVAVAEEGWSILPRARVTAAFSANPAGVGGTHGYDPRLQSMHAIFVAAGPAFPVNLVVPPFENIHVYNALCRALGIEAAPNDGDPAVAATVLRPAIEPR